MPPVPHAGASPCESREWFRLVARKPPMLLLNPRCCTCRTRVCDECGSSRKQQCESTLHMREPHRNASVPRVCGIPTVGRLSELWCVAVGQKQNTHAPTSPTGGPWFEIDVTVSGSGSVLVWFWFGSDSEPGRRSSAAFALRCLGALLALQKISSAQQSGDTGGQRYSAQFHERFDRQRPEFGEFRSLSPP